MTSYELIGMAITCLREVRTSNYKGLAHYEKDATETALYYLERTAQTWETIKPCPYPPKWKDEIACIKCGFMVTRPVEGRASSACQTCGASYEREAFL
jgi:hypothetical protein